MSEIQTASEADEILAREIVDAFVLPDEVEKIGIERGTDHTGSPALWLWFHLKSDEAPPPDRMRALTHFVANLESRIISSPVRAWPHSRFADATG